MKSSVPGINALGDLRQAGRRICRSRPGGRIRRGHKILKNRLVKDLQ